jgi:hypothetical protein
VQIPIKLRILAALAGVNASDFAVGWIQGVGRWRRRHEREGVGSNPFPLGSVCRAASAAAVAFCAAMDEEAVR